MNKRTDPVFFGNRPGDMERLKKSIDFLYEEIRNTFFGNSPFLRNDSLQSNLAREIPDYARGSEKVLKEFVFAFKDIIQWNHANTLHNITSPILIDGVAAKTLTSLYNPNCIWDFVSGHFAELERAVSDQVAHLIGWKKGYLGTSTFGGKETLVYAIKLGLNRCNPESIISGITGNEVVLTSESNHYSIEYVTNLLGLGKQACIRIPVDKDGLLDLPEFKKFLEEALSSSKRVACIVLSAGNSLNNTIDPIKEVSDFVNYCVDKYQLAYRPFIHADSVIGWLWLTFRSYDFETNSLSIREQVLAKIRLAHERVQQCVYADSMGVDFHKNAFASYISSLYLCKDGTELTSLNSTKKISADVQVYGNNFFQHYTQEHSRSGEGVASAYVCLQETGVEGFQEYIVAMMQIHQHIEQNIDSSQYEVINPNGLGFPVVVFPKSFNVAYLELVTQSDEYIKQIQKYCLALFKEISSTSDSPTVIGYISNYTKSKTGLDIPAFKLYPMSYCTTEGTIEASLAQLVKIKKNFDLKAIAFSSVSQSRGIIFPK